VSISYTLLWVEVGEVPEWIIEEHESPSGQSHFGDFVDGLSDSKDVKDAAVLIGALRALGNQLREPRSKSLSGGLFELRGTRIRIYFGFLPGRRVVLLGGYIKKRDDTPPDVLWLMRKRLKEAQDAS
jgi:hypothetical protein